MAKYLKHICLILIYAACCCTAIYGQSFNADSIQSVIKNTEDTLPKIDLLNQYAYEFRSSQTDLSIQFSRQAIQLADSKRLPQQTIEAYSNLGLAYQYKGNYAESLIQFQRALKTLDAFKDPELKAKIFNNMGNLYWRTNDKQQAYNYYKKSMSIREEIKDSIGLAKVLGNLGNSMNAIYHDGDSAFYYYSRALSIFQDLNDQRGIAISYNNLANIYRAKGDLEKALSLYHQALAIDIKSNDIFGTTFDYSNIGTVHNDLGNKDSAVYYFKTLLKVSEEINSLPRQKQAYGRLYKLYKKYGNSSAALEYLELYKQSNDSLINERSKDRMAEIKYQYENDLKERELELLRAESEKQDIELSKKYYQVIFLILALFIIAIVTFGLWRRFETKSRLYNKLQEKSDELETAQKLIEERNDELVAINENLENKVRERTKELSNAYQNLLISNQRLDHFTYRSAHDLKGPIASILGLINLLNDSLDKKSLKEELELVSYLNQTALKMDNLLKRIVQSTQISQKILQKQEFDIEELLDQVIESIRVNDSQSDIIVKCEIEGEKLLYNDPSILLIILRYLVYNSIQYVDEKKKDKLIILRTESSVSGFCRIHVLDNGRGVDPELIPDLFKMFSKGSGEAANPGLGLYDANVLAEKIGGEVYFEDADTEYTHFVVSFPFKN